MSTGAIHQGVLIDPSHPSGIRPQGRLGTSRQTALYLAQVLQHPRASPIHIGTVFEQHVHEAVAEKGIAAHGFGAGYREHGGGQWIGHLVLDDLWRLTWVRGAN